jgi:hypothetical protein
MKMSREDFAIGWLVAFESFRKDVSLLRASGKGRAGTSTEVMESITPA